MWCVSELDRAYLTKMEDVLALYEKSYCPKEPVVRLDEKPVSLHAEVRPGRPARPGHLAKRDNEYQRRGTANIFAVVEPKAGRHFTRATQNRSPRTIHLVVNNFNTHCETSLTKAGASPVASGVISRSTTRRSTAAGSIKRRSN